jgi:hypothetical protein
MRFGLVHPYLWPGGFRRELPSWDMSIFDFHGEDGGENEMEDVV